MGLCAALLLASWLRLPRLEVRPMHGDEAVHAAKMGEMQSGDYAYDPREYHGPTLYFFAWPLAQIAGETSFARLSENTLRGTTALFGLALIPLLWLLRDGFASSRWWLVWAALFTSASPLFVFYARYYIQETLLVFWSAWFFACLWRAQKSAKPRAWIVAASVGAGIMLATKETAVIALACVALAALVAKWRFSLRQVLAGAACLYGVAAIMLMPDLMMGALKGVTFCAQSLRAARNAGGVRNLLGLLKSQLVKQADYDTIQGARILDDVPEAAEIAARMQARNVKALDGASYTGSAPSQQNLDDLAHFVDGDTVAKHRIENLFNDADQSRRRTGEVAQALSLEKKNGITLRRITDADKAAGKDGDFIDVASHKTNDPVGRYDDDGFDNKYFDIETYFKPAFKKHMDDPKIDVVVVDTTGLTPSQADEVVAYAKSYSLPEGKALDFLPLPPTP